MIYAKNDPFICEGIVTKIILDTRGLFPVFRITYSQMRHLSIISFNQTQCLL